MGWTTEESEFESRWGQEFSLLQIFQTGSEVHRTTCPMGTPGVKRPGHEADHSPPTCAEVINVDLYVHSPYVFMA
jgi:hypothetical protein